MNMEPIVSSETSAIRIQTPENYPKRNKLHLEHGESLKTLWLGLHSDTFTLRDEWPNTTRQQVTLPPRTFIQNLLEEPTRELRPLSCSCGLFSFLPLIANQDTRMTAQKRHQEISFSGHRIIIRNPPLIREVKGRWYTHRELGGVYLTTTFVEAFLLRQSN